VLGHIQHRNSLLKVVIEGNVKGWGDVKEGVRSCWISLRKRGDI
jgi:hypothetical protein